MPDLHEDPRLFPDLIVYLIKNAGKTHKTIGAYRPVGSVKPVGAGKPIRSGKPVG